MQRRIGFSRLYKGWLAFIPSGAVNVAQSETCLVQSSNLHLSVIFSRLNIVARLITFHTPIRRQRMKTSGGGHIASAIAVVLSSQFLCAAASRADDEGHRVGRVLLISIDGFHAFDLTTCVPSGGCPNLAVLSRRGVTYTNARTTTPSDSFPGLLAQLTVVTL